MPLFTLHTVCVLISCSLSYPTPSGSPLDLQTACAIYSNKNELHFWEITYWTHQTEQWTEKKSPEAGYLTYYVTDDIGIV